MKIKNRIYFDYDDVLTMCHNLAYNIETWKPDLIVGIKRGGVVPALHLSHELDKPMEVITWQTRDNSMQEHNDRIKEMIRDDRRVMFVDDINDTGRTIEEIKAAYNPNSLNSVGFSSLVEKTESIIQCTVSSLKIDSEKWIVWPWEKV